MLLAISILLFLPSWGTATSTHRDTRYYSNEGSRFQPSATQPYGAQAYPGGGYGFQQAPQQAQETMSPDKLPALGGVSFTQPTAFEFDHKVRHIGGENLGIGGVKGHAATGQQAYYAAPATGDYVPQAAGNAYGGAPAGGYDSTYGNQRRYGGDYPSGSYRYRTTSRPPQGGRRYPQGTNMHYSYGGQHQPKRYNNEQAYSYEKVYPEQRYSHNHAVSYHKNFGDDAPKGYESHQESRSPSSYGQSYSPPQTYGPSASHAPPQSYGPPPSHAPPQSYGPPPSHGPPPSYGPQPSRGMSYDGQSSGSHGEPRMRSYVYRDPYDKSTTKVVAMHRGTPAASANMLDKNGGMDGFIEDIMRKARGEYH